MDAPKNYVSYVIHNATNKGVEAKEVEIRNPQFDMNSISLAHLQSDSSESTSRVGDKSVEGHRGDDPLNPAATSNSTDSYLHVVVQKHRTKDQGVNANKFSPTSRLPSASSPIKPQQNYAEYGNPAGNTGMYVFPHPMLYYPTIPSWHHSKMRGLVDTATSARSSSSFKKFVRAVRSEKKECMATDIIPEDDVVTENKWNCFGKNDLTMDAHNESPERIEVYYFERGCVDYLSTTDCSPMPVTEKFVIRSGRVAERVFAELCSVPQLFVTIPVELLIQSQRLVLIAIRNIMVKSTQTCSDYFLKPLLALLFNAIIQPPLIFAGNIASGVRNTLQPMFGIVDDLMSPIGKLLSSFHFIQIDKRCEKCTIHNV